MNDKRKNLITAAAVAFGLVMIPGVANAHDPHGNGDGGGHNHSDSAPAAVSQEELETLGDTCEGNSDLALHDGFQNEAAVCVDTEFGEQSAFEDNPTLLIVDAPRKVKVGEDIVLRVSTRNLVRDRFLGAAAGGYYLESAFLNEEGLTRGHFHTGCRMLGDDDEAPKPFRIEGEGKFVATEDSQGGAEPDVVEVTISGFEERGVVQCASWAGDGSHRIPMMSFANEIPAFDVVRIEVKGGKM